MWVSRKEFDVLKAELNVLRAKQESHAMDVARCRNITVYGKKETYENYGIHRSYVHQEISLKDAVLRIIDHLGMVLVYVEGKPTSVGMQKKAKA